MGNSEDISRFAEQAIWEAFRSGDMQAFSKIYHAHYHLLFDYGYKIVQDEDMVKDILHDFFLYLCERKSQLGSVASIKFYLIKSFRRRLLVEIKRQRKKRQQLEAIREDLSSFTFSIENHVIQSETEVQRTEAIIKLIEALSPRKKEIIYLRYFSQLSPKEIASILSLNYQTVINHLHESLAMLRAHKQQLHQIKKLVY